MKVKQSHEQFLVSIVILICMTGCSTEVTPTFPVPEVAEIATTGLLAEQDPLHSVYGLTTTQSACERVKELGSFISEGQGTYSYFSSIRKEADDFVGASRIDQNPYFDFLLGNQNTIGLVNLPGEDFYSAASVLMGFQDCDLAESSEWTFGCRNLWDSSIANANVPGCARDGSAPSSACRSIWEEIKRDQGVARCLGTSPSADCVANQELVDEIAENLAAGTIHQSKNKFLELTYPGIFAPLGTSAPEEATLENSLLLKLFERVVGPQSFYTNPEARALLETKLPMFTGVSWNYWRADLLRSLQTSARYLNRSTSPVDELTCAYILTQRSFSQFLRVVGYPGLPIVENSGPGIPPLDSQMRGITPQERVGRYFEPAFHEYLALDRYLLETYHPESPDDLIVLDQFASSSVDPAEGARFPVQGTPVLGDLSANLNSLESYAILFEWASPAAGWNNSGRYLFGNINQNSSSAVFPSGFFSMLTGTIGMNIRNLIAQEFLVRVDDAGEKTDEPERVRGLYLFERSLLGESEGAVNLSDVVQLARIIFLLDASIENIRTVGINEIQRIDAQFSPEIFQTLEGAILPALQRLKIPVLTLLNRMAFTDRGCASRLRVRLDAQIAAEDRVLVDGPQICDADLLNAARSAQILLRGSILR